MSGDFTIEYVELPNGRVPAREFVDSLDDKAAARIDAFVDRLRIYGNRMQGKFVKKLTNDIFELRVKQFDRIFRVLFFYRPGMLIVITSGFQKKTEQTPPGEIARAEQLRKLWLKYRNHYTRVLFFYRPGMLIVITSGFQKKTEQSPPGEITRAEQLRKLWLKYRNHYTGSQKERENILRELGQ